MMTILDYQEKLQQHSPCEEGATSFIGCKNRKEVFEMLANPKYADFVLKSMKEGWGPGKEDFVSVFRPYLNGAHSVKIKLNENRIAYSEVWCDADEITIGNNIRFLLVIGCNGIINIKSWQVVKIMVDSNSRVEINAPKNSLVFVESFGGKISDINGNCKIQYE